MAVTPAKPAMSSSKLHSLIPLTAQTFQPALAPPPPPPPADVSDAFPAAKKTRCKRVTVEHTRARVRDNQRRFRAQKKERLAELEELDKRNREVIKGLRQEIGELREEMRRCGQHEEVVDKDRDGDKDMAIEGLQTGGAENVVRDIFGEVGACGLLEGIDNINTSNQEVMDLMYAGTTRPLSPLPSTSLVPATSSNITAPLDPFTNSYFLPFHPNTTSTISTDPMAPATPTAATAATAAGPSTPVLFFKNPRPIPPTDMSSFMTQAMRTLRPSCRRGTPCCTDQLTIVSLTGNHVSYPPGHIANNDSGAVTCLLGPSCCAEDLPSLADVTELDEDDDDEEEEIVCKEPEKHGPHLPKGVRGMGHWGEEGTTPCMQAVVMVTQGNFRGLDQATIVKWLQGGFVRGGSGEEGCRIDNRLLYSLLAYMSQ